MTPAALLLAAFAPAADLSDAHDLLVQMGDAPAVRVRLQIEVNGKPLTTLDAAAKQEREKLAGKPGVSAVDSLLPDGSLLRVAAVPSSPYSGAVSQAIFKALDADGDGKLSEAELLAAEKALGKFDHDDDECVPPLELVPDLQTVVPAKTAKASVTVRMVPVEGKADFEQKIQAGKIGYWTSKPAGMTMALFARPPLPADKAAVPKSLLADNRQEAKAVFESVADGLVSVFVVPGPVGLFDRLDTDRDGQLSVAELRQAKSILAGEATSDNCVSLVIVPGAAKPPAVPLVRTFVHDHGPAWFRGMDKNGDGWVSKREFLGTAEQFAKLDGNKDGLISPTEADTAGKP